MDDDPPTRDPGLQPERTSLAWQRTAVALLLVATAAAVAATHLLVPARGAADRLLLAATLLVVAAVGAGARATTRPVRAARPSPWPRLVAVAGLAGLLALLGAAVALGGLLAPRA